MPWLRYIPEALQEQYLQEYEIPERNTGVRVPENVKCALIGSQFPFTALHRLLRNEDKDDRQLLLKDLYLFVPDYVLLLNICITLYIYM